MLQRKRVPRVELHPLEEPARRFLPLTLPAEHEADPVEGVAAAWPQRQGGLELFERAGIVEKSPVGVVTLREARLREIWREGGKPIDRFLRSLDVLRLAVEEGEID